MSVLNLEFFVFLTIVLLVYYVIPGKFQWVWLLISSLYYFCYHTVWYQLIFFVVFLVINYIATLFMNEDSKHRKKVFTTVLISDILIFVFLKYPDFFLNSFTWITVKLGHPFSSSRINYAVSMCKEYCPPHIAYFGLIIIGYICDVYWGKIRAQKNPGKYVLFAGFFPLMTSGPIVTYSQMENELFGEKKKFSYDRFISASERILWGAFKKLVVAGRAAVIVDTIYSKYEIYAGFYIPLAAAMFVCQLYADFSGLMDIVIGTAELFGITLPENFNLPFLSTNLQEFWRRWHITLGEWLKNYVLFPIYRSKTFRNLNKWCKKKWGKHYEKKFDLPSNIALFISWFIIGLWHGGGWNYIFGVGLYMWIIIVISNTFKPYFEKVPKLLKINTECFSYTLFQRIRTFIIYAFGLSFFRAENLTEGFKMWKSMFSLCNPWIFVDKSLLNLGLNRLEIEVLIIGIFVMLIVSIFMQRGSVRAQLKTQGFVFRLVLFVVLFVVTVVYGYYGAGYNAASFIYGRF